MSRTAANTRERITLMIDKDLDKKLRHLQAKKIQTSEGSYSFSDAVNDILKKGLK